MLPKTANLSTRTSRRSTTTAPREQPGGLIQLFGVQESEAHKSIFQRTPKALNPPAPELVRIKKDDPNRAAEFDYTLLAPQTHTQASSSRFTDTRMPTASPLVRRRRRLQVAAHGRVRDRASHAMRIELISHGFGIELQVGYPQMTFKIQPGMHTYKAALKAFRAAAAAGPCVDSKKTPSRT